MKQSCDCPATSVTVVFGHAKPVGTVASPGGGARVGGRTAPDTESLVGPGSAGAGSLVVPGAAHVKVQAEAIGLHRVFQEAGFEWREPGCSMCVGAGGDRR